MRALTRLYPTITRTTGYEAIKKGYGDE